MKGRNISIISLLFVLALLISSTILVSGFAITGHVIEISPSSVQLLPGTPTNPAAIGGDKDEHGCYIAAGYSWCESKQKCLRTWEENCSTSGCSNLWWFDSKTKVCGQKQFCGSYMYQGLQTFTTLEACKAALPVVCTADVKQCLDGSYVGRVAPDCDFAPCPSLCKDSDGGKNYYLKGKATGNDGTTEDSCVIISIQDGLGTTTSVPSCEPGPNCKISEALCNDIEGTYADFYNCPNGCEDGACIQTTGCSNLWWFDNSNKLCGQKQFCDSFFPYSYMYLGLQTFTTLEACKSALLVVCTADVKQCLDGSYVSRVAPNCDFAPCTGEKPVVEPPVCDNWGAEEEGWYANNELVKLEKCHCAAICSYEGTRSEGWYNSYNNALITFGKCPVPTTGTATGTTPAPTPVSATGIGGPDQPIEINMDDKPVTLSQDPSHTEVSINSVDTATTTETLRVSEGRIDMMTNMGAVEIKYLPEEARRTASAIHKLTQIDNIQLTDENGKAVYVVHGTESYKILWIIPASRNIAVKVDATTNDIVQ